MLSFYKCDEIFLIDKGKKKNGDSEALEGSSDFKVDLGKRKTKRQAATKASKKVRVKILCAQLYEQKCRYTHSTKWPFLHV